MSKAKKTWLPIIIVAALAAIIVMIALIVSPLNEEESAELKETPAPVESTTPEDAEPQESLSPEMQALLDELSGEGGSKKSSDTKKSDTKQSTGTKQSSGTKQNTGTKQGSGTGQTAEKKDPLTELGKGLAGAATGMAESAGELVGKLHDISRSYSTGDVAGILETPLEFADGVFDFVTGVIGSAVGGK